MKYEVIQTHAGPYKKGDVLGEEHIAAAGATVDDWLRLKAVKETDPGRTPVLVIEPETPALPANPGAPAALDMRLVRAIVREELESQPTPEPPAPAQVDPDAVRAIVREEIAAVLTELQGAPADQAVATGKPPKNS